MRLICEQCNKVFTRFKRRRFCSLDCAYLWMKGRPQSPEFIVKRSISMRGIKKSPEHIVKMRQNALQMWKDGRFHCKHHKTTNSGKEKIVKPVSVIVTEKKAVFKRRKWVSTCIVCGASFSSRKKDKLYCCEKCKDNRHSHACLHCHKEFRGRKLQKYCCYSCDKSHRQEMALITFTCAYCGKQLKMKRSFAERKKYCSVCIKKMRKHLARRASKIARPINKVRMLGKNNPIFTHPESFHNGMHTYSGMKTQFRSKWEANMFQIFEYLGLHPEYEAVTFPLSDGKTYTPDFYLNETDEFIEVKGRWYADALHKVQLFQKDYPNISFEVIEQSKYKQYVREFPSICQQ